MLALYLIIAVVILLIILYMANTGFIRIEQEDKNPNSPTYGQKRWVDGGKDLGRCPLPDTSAHWTDLTGTRCQQSTEGENTGYLERQQQDTNPLSPTYNQTRWTQINKDTVMCPLPNVEPVFTTQEGTDFFKEQEETCAAPMNRWLFTETGQFNIGERIWVSQFTDGSTAEPAPDNETWYLRDISGSGKLIEVFNQRISSITESCA